jgi:hypothetical protein
VDGYIHYPAYWADARNSHAHGWSSGPTAALMQGILGIELTSPLGATWTIRPQLTKWLSYATGGFATRLGKFEVAISLMVSVSTGRKVEMIDITVPHDTNGCIIWSRSAIFVTSAITNVIGVRRKFWRYLDDEIALETQGRESDDIYVWTSAQESEFVKDESWVKPEVEERPEGVVDWDLLEEGYALAERKFMGPQTAQNAKEDLRLQMELVENNQGLREEKLGNRKGIEEYKKQLEKLEEMNKVKLGGERVKQDFGDGGIGREELKKREMT